MRNETLDLHHRDSNPQTPSGVDSKVGTSTDSPSGDVTQNGGESIRISRGAVRTAAPGGGVQILLASGEPAGTHSAVATFQNIERRSDAGAEGNVDPLFIALENFSHWLDDGDY